MEQTVRTPAQPPLPHITATRKDAEAAAASLHIVARPDNRIGTILRAHHTLDSGDIERIVEMQDSKGLRFGEAAVRLGLITVRDLRRALAQQYDLPHLLPENDRSDSELVVAFDPFNRCAEQMRTRRNNEKAQPRQPIPAATSRSQRPRTTGSTTHKQKETKR